MLGNEGYIHVFRICNYYFFFTAAMATLMRLILGHMYINL